MCGQLDIDLTLSVSQSWHEVPFGIRVINGIVNKHGDKCFTLVNNTILKSFSYWNKRVDSYCRLHLNLNHSYVQDGTSGVSPSRPRYWWSRETGGGCCCCSEVSGMQRADLDGPLRPNTLLRRDPGPRTTCGTLAHTVLSNNVPQRKTNK